MKNYNVVKIIIYWIIMTEKLIFKMTISHFRNEIFLKLLIYIYNNGFLKRKWYNVFNDIVDRIFCSYLTMHIVYNHMNYLQMHDKLERDFVICWKLKIVQDVIKLLQFLIVNK